MPSITANKVRQMIDEPLAEIVVQSDDGERMSLFVRWGDLEKAWAFAAYRLEGPKEGELVSGYYPLP